MSSLIALWRLPSVIVRFTPDCRVGSWLVWIWYNIVSHLRNTCTRFANFIAAPPGPSGSCVRGRPLVLWIGSRRLDCLGRRPRRRPSCNTFAVPDRQGKSLQFEAKIYIAVANIYESFQEHGRSVERRRGYTRTCTPQMPHPIYNS